jgi:hypothetical protein
MQRGEIQFRMGLNFRGGAHSIHMKSSPECHQSERSLLVAANFQEPAISANHLDTDCANLRQQFSVVGIDIGGSDDGKDTTGAG